MAREGTQAAQAGGRPSACTRTFVHLVFADVIGRAQVLEQLGQASCHRIMVAALHDPTQRLVNQLMLEQMWMSATHPNTTSDRALQPF